MAVYKCGGTKRTRDDGEPVCEYEAERPWTGRCPSCAGLYTIIKVGADKVKSTRATLATLGEVKAKPRISTGLPGFDEVLGGGGLVPGSSVFISGPPGGGKSTLLLTTANNVAQGSRTVVYASGEQKNEDIALIAHRIGALNDNVRVMGLEGDIWKITEECESDKPVVLVIDSLQTAFVQDCKADEGSAEQCRAVTNYLTAWCKREDVAVVIVCHVNKEGDLAGPKAAEHLVDTVTELDPSPEFDEDGEEIPGTGEKRKCLRSGKNRYGASGVEAYFEMSAEGLKPAESKKKKKSKLFVVEGGAREKDDGESPVERKKRLLESLKKGKDEEKKD